MPAPANHAELLTLIGLFYDAPDNLGDFAEVAAGELPHPYGLLLAHNQHMTVTVEGFHHSAVDVRVLESKRSGPHYSRRILLTRQHDHRVVQFGIVRLNFDFLSPEVSAEIESQRTPLGRILIEHDVLREIELISLWRVNPGPDLSELFELPARQVTFGRTAVIHCNGEPAVELLEIVAPVG